MLVEVNNGIENTTVKEFIDFSHMNETICTRSLWCRLRMQKLPSDLWMNLHIKSQHLIEVEEPFFLAVIYQELIWNLYIMFAGNLIYESLSIMRGISV